MGSFDAYSSRPSRARLVRIEAATVVARMVEKGRVVGLGASQSVFVKGGKAWEGLLGRGWGFSTEWE